MGSCDSSVTTAKTLQTVDLDNLKPSVFLPKNQADRQRDWSFEDEMFVSGDLFLEHSNK